MDLSVELDALRARMSAKWQAFDADVIPAWVAEMDFPLAEPIARALHDAIARSDTGYMHVGALPEVTASFAQRTWGWQVAHDQVIVVPDVLTGVAIVIEAFTEPDAGIIINTPVYPPFFSTIERVCSRRVVDVPMARDASGRYALDVDAIIATFARPDVSALLLCSPHNPTGTVPTAAELEHIARAAAAHQIVVISDEIHAPLTLPGVVHTPYLAVAEPQVPAASVISASKAWNTAGLKCAQVVMSTPDQAAALVAATPSETLYGTGHLGVLAAIASYTEGEPWLREVREQIARNARRVQGFVGSRMPNVGYVSPEATYLAWLDFANTSIAEDPTAAILERGRVALSAGPMFGANGAGFARLNLGTSASILDEVLERIADVVSGA